MSAKRWGCVGSLTVLLGLMTLAYLGQDARKEVKAARGMMTLKQIYMAAVLYSSDHQGRLPPMQDVATVRLALRPYLRDDGVWSNPEPARRLFWRAKPEGEWYRPNPMLSGAKLAPEGEDAKEIVMFYEREPIRNEGRYAVFLDGHIQRLDHSTWEAVRRASRIP